VIHAWNEKLWRMVAGMDPFPPQPLLLAGPRGVGKEVFARTLAHWLLCRDAAATGPCGSCMACRLLASGNHPDYREIRPGVPEEGDEAAEETEVRASKRSASRWIKVDQARDLSGFVQLAPHFGARKAIVIVEADRLHPSAANALLKTLEEPPAGRHFLLVTSRPQRLLPTVRSRCIRLQFRLPTEDDALTWLAGEDVGNARAALAMAGGAPLRALELQTDASVRSWIVERFLLSPDADPVELSGGIDAEKLPAVIDTLQRWCHDLVQVRLTGSPRYHTDRAQILHHTAAQADLPGLLRYLRTLQSTIRTLEHPLNLRLVAESCLIGYRNVFSARR
jgi:DNA polymerase-3 subunit delta'